MWLTVSVPAAGLQHSLTIQTSNMTFNAYLCHKSNVVVMVGRPREPKPSQAAFPVGLKIPSWKISYFEIHLCQCSIRGLAYFSSKPKLLPEQGHLGNHLYRRISLMM